MRHDVVMIFSAKYDKSLCFEDLPCNPRDARTCTKLPGSVAEWCAWQYTVHVRTHQQGTRYYTSGTKPITGSACSLPHLQKLQCSAAKRSSRAGKTLASASPRLQARMTANIESQDEIRILSETSRLSDVSCPFPILRRHVVINKGVGGAHVPSLISLHTVSHESHSTLSAPSFGLHP
jgi:hypothetical protein